MKKKINKQIWEKIVQGIIANNSLKTCSVGQRKMPINIHYILHKAHKTASR